MIGFEDFKLSKQFLNAIEDLAYTQPTPVQEKTIPLILAGHDVMGIAQTGTGKTLAYILPVLKKLNYAQGQHPRALVLAPTRELAMQIDAVAKELAKYTDIRHAAIFGGVGMKAQIETLQKGLDLLIATPGRMMDLYFKEELVLKNLNTLILDEADKMMDMGFMHQIRKILEIIPRKRQNLLFSATMAEKVLRLSEEFLEFPEIIEITPQATAAETVNQKLYKVPNLKTKLNLLELFLNDKEVFSKVIVFVRSRQNAENVFKYLRRKLKDDEVRAIHANKDQNSRSNSMEAFKNEEIRVLVATDVAARGIDVNMVSHVINFDIPLVYEDYVHRIGRTGRAYQSGEAITFATPADIYHIEKIEKIIKMPVPIAKLPAELEILETPFEEAQEIAKEIDKQKKKEDPDFQGAFHEKKNKNSKKNQKTLPKSKGAFHEKKDKNNKKINYSMKQKKNLKRKK